MGGPFAGLPVSTLGYNTTGGRYNTYRSFNSDTHIKSKDGHKANSDAAPGEKDDKFKSKFSGDENTPDDNILKFEAIINPIITHYSDDKANMLEGCLSFPNKLVDIVRPKNITLTTLTIMGKEITLHAYDLYSRVLQHEVDHLQGILFTQRMKPKYTKLIERYKYEVY